MSHHIASGLTGGKAHFPRERSREGCTRVDGVKHVQMLPQACRAPPKQKEDTDLCTAPPQLYLWGSRWPPGRLTAGSNTNYSETTCPLPGLLGCIWHDLSRKYILFCSATCCTINILTASLLFARHVPKLCFPPCWIMLLWILFPIFFCKLQLLVF